MSMGPVYVTLADASVTAKSQVIPMNWKVSPFQVTLRADVTGSVVYSVQYTTDNIRANGWTEAGATWVAVTGMDAVSANAEATLISPVRAVRLLLSSGTGSVAFDVISAG